MNQEKAVKPKNHTYAKNSITAEIKEMLYKHVPGGIVMYEWNGKRAKSLFISDYYAKCYGSSVMGNGDNQNEPDILRIHPDDIATYQEAFNKGLSETHEMEHVCRIWNEQSGKYLWMKVNAVFHPGENDTTICYAMYSDVTEQQEALEREKRLSRCLKLMTNDDNIEENLREVMKIVATQYDAARVYIFEFDWVNHQMSNTYEYVGKNVTAEKENLQKMDIDCISHWMVSFKRGDPVFIDDLEKIKDIPGRKSEYEVLKPQNIHSLMTIPINKYGFLYGYVGVDNPEDHVGDKDFLTSVAYILSQEFYNREQQKKLIEMSLRDPLSRLNNRYSYDQKIEKLEEKNIQGMGVLFADINGLKYMNDNFGHKEGDQLICLAADVLRRFFDESQIYRISGDEFVVLCPDIEEAKFMELGKNLILEIVDSCCSILSVGLAWKFDTKDINELLNIAERNMYTNKEKYHEENPLTRRAK